MKMRTVVGILLNLVAIVVCGAIGAIGGYGTVEWLDLSGVVGALVAAFVGMVLATAAWAAGATLLRGAGILR